MTVPALEEIQSKSDLVVLLKLSVSFPGMCFGSVATGRVSARVLGSPVQCDGPLCGP
jgi:hypothetical protein